MVQRPPDEEDSTSEEEAPVFDRTATDQLDDNYRLRVVIASESREALELGSVIPNAAGTFNCLKALEPGAGRRRRNAARTGVRASSHDGPRSRMCSMKEVEQLDQLSLTSVVTTLVETIPENDPEPKPSGIAPSSVKGDTTINEILEADFTPAAESRSGLTIRNAVELHPPLGGPFCRPISARLAQTLGMPRITDSGLEALKAQYDAAHSAYKAAAQIRAQATVSGTDVWDHILEAEAEHSAP